MGEIALYRKYRPGSFSEVMGQDHVVSVLENEAKSGKIAHAYIFSGSRGTGKTSVARIFAKALGTNPEDIYEMDAASNRGIDEIREIRDSVHTYPYSSKYKIYIIDEAHMLTRDAWNAFLKTLEEPPEHCIFIMATTEQHKLPDTIVSRCESFAFHKPTHETIMTSVLKVAKAEEYKIEKKSASLIATLADGSFRDALSILQKAIHSHPGVSSAKASADQCKELSHTEVEKVLGAPDESLILAVLEGVSDQNSEKALGAVKRAVDANIDMQVFLKMILRSMRFVLLLRFAKEMSEFVKNQTGEEEFQKLSELANPSTDGAKNLNSKVLLSFLEAYSQQAYASIPELPIELAIIANCDPTPRSA